MPSGLFEMPELCLKRRFLGVEEGMTVTFKIEFSLLLLSFLDENNRLWYIPESF